MFTRYQSKIVDSEPAYDTRLQARMRKAYGDKNVDSTQTEPDNENIRLQFDVNIDFDGASQAWNQNKKRDGQMYSYVCGEKCSSTGRPCQKVPSRGSDSCRLHTPK
jgi:hypothetical protein|tara:strand:+ start:729 stop:1046 length:318 start_codon:yes stop_codon:yes gene_type:complete